MNNNPRTKKLVIFGAISLVVLASLFFVMKLVTSKRIKPLKTRAYYAQAKTWFLPYQAPLKNIGEQFSVSLVADFGTLDIVGFTIKITYSPDKLGLANGAADIIVNSGFTSEVKKEVRAAAGEIYLSFVNINGVTGVLGLDNPWVKFNFTVKDLGTAALALDKTYSSYQVVGVTSGADSSIDLKNETGGDLINVSYNLGASTLTPTPTPTLACPAVLIHQWEKCLGTTYNTIVSWGDISADGYEVYRNNTLVNRDISLRYVDTHVSCNVTYVYNVKPYYQDQPSKNCEQNVSLTCPCVTGGLTPTPTTTSGPLPPPPEETSSPTPTATQTPAETLTPTATSTPGACACSNGRLTKPDGDANCDGEINGLDYDLWLLQFHGTPDPDLAKSADFNCDGKVDGIDFEYWRRGQT